jgi:hypothetical protein
MTTPEEFRARTLAKHHHTFDVIGRVAEVMQALVVTPRALPDLPARAVDMLFPQAFKSLVATRELAALALVEDAATLVRRLLEIAVQAVYIARDSEEATRTERAGAYLAFLWHKWPADLRTQLPAVEQQAWNAVYRTHGTRLTPGRKSWGPTFREMFEYAEQAGTYKEDYGYLSNVAHGGPPSLVHRYAQPTVFLHDDREVGGLLLHASGYALATTMVWNDIFGVADAAELTRLRDMVLAARGGRRGPDGAAPPPDTGPS